MTSKSEILNFLSTNKLLLKENYKVNTIALFGSYARDEATVQSDIDILVDMPSSFDNYFNLKYFLEDAFKTRVDLGKEKTIRRFVKDRIKHELLYV